MILRLSDKIQKLTDINSAIEIGIMVQVYADSIGYNMYSGVGGQMDFIRGAALSEGGKLIIALNANLRVYRKLYRISKKE